MVGGEPQDGQGGGLLPEPLEEAIPEGTRETLADSLAEIWDGFVEHLPLIFAGALVVLLGGALTHLVRLVVGRLLRRTRLRRSLRELAERLIHVGLWVLVLLLAALVVFPGLTPTRALGGLGVASVAVGFAFKDIFENFFAGVLILWRFPFDNGDVIECGELLGRVERITVRNTLLRRPSGEILVVPNSRLFTEPVEVLTAERSRRIEARIGIAYGEDAERARDVVAEALESCASPHPSPPPEVLVDGFGSSSVDLALLWWTDPDLLEVRRSRSEVLAAAKRALDEHGIEIPFPYRTLVFKNAPPTEG